MQEIIDRSLREFSGIRTGVSPSIFSSVRVEYYGTFTPLLQLVSAKVSDGRLITLEPYDKAALKAIEKAIASDQSLALNPTNDGNVIRVAVPELTRERRLEYVKLAKAQAEEGRVAVRSARRKAKSQLDSLKSSISEDEIARTEKEVDTIVKDAISQIDQALKNKEHELMEV